MLWLHLIITNTKYTMPAPPIVSYVFFLTAQIFNYNPINLELYKKFNEVNFVSSKRYIRIHR